MTKVCNECRATRPVSQFLPARDGRRIGRCIGCLKAEAQRYRNRASAEAKTIRQRRSKRDAEAVRHWQKPL